jgi:LysR family nitrogen assimilation transcriptional regulator
VRSAGGDVQGTVSLGMSSTLASYLAGSFMEACRAAYPKIRLRLVTGDSLQIKSRIDAGQVDFAVLFEDEPTPGYLRQPLFRQRLYLVRREPLPDGSASVSVAALAELPMVLPALPNVTRLLLDRVFAETGIVPNMAGEADVLSSMLSAVQMGMGDTIVPKGDFSDVPGHATLLPVPIEPAIFLTAAMLSSNEASLGRTAALVRNLFSGFVFKTISDAPPPGAEWVGKTP